MKKTFGVLVLVVIFLAFITTAYCSDTEYKIPELYMTVTLPDDYTVLTRDTAADDPGLAKLGIDLDDLNSMFEQQKMYVNAIQKDITDEFIITMVSDDNIKKAFNLKRASEEELNKFLTSLDDGFSKMGATLTNTTRYEHKQALFIVADFTNDTIASTSRMYSTLINGQFINFTLHSYTGTFTDAQASVLQQIVDSAVFVEQSNFDWTYVIVGGIVGAIGGGIIGLIKHRQKKKIDAIIAESSVLEPPASESPVSDPPVSE